MEKLNKKGMTLTEIIVSVGLTSIVLVFLMNLFLNVRGLYNTSKASADYDMQTSRLVSAIGNDIDKYGLYCVREVTTSDYEGYLFIFDEARPTKMSDHIKKLFLARKVTIPSTSKSFIMLSYGYDVKFTNDITGEERITKVTNEMPSDAIFGLGNMELSGKSIDGGKNIIELKVPILNSKGTDYSINIYGVASKIGDFRCSDEEISRV